MSLTASSILFTILKFIQNFNMIDINNFQVAEIEISYRPSCNYHNYVKTADDAYEILYNAFNQNTIAYKEEMIVLYFNRPGKLLGVYKIAEGGTASVIGDVKIIFGVALKIAASNIIIAHNHPSGNIKPSDADIRFTSKIAQAAELLDIKLLDHLIISPVKGEYRRIEIV